MNLADYFAWQDYPKKDKLLQKTKPRNDQEYKKQLLKYDKRQQELEDFRSRKKRIQDILNVNNLIRGVKPIKNRNKWSE